VKIIYACLDDNSIKIGIKSGGLLALSKIIGALDATKKS